MQGHQYNVEWQVNDGEKHQEIVRQYPDNPNFKGVEDIIYSEKIGNDIPLPPGETTNIIISVELQNGSNPTAHNAFSIDVQKDMVQSGLFEVKIIKCIWTQSTELKMLFYTIKINIERRNEV